MVELMDIQGYAQQIAEAIAAVLKIDVEIADKNLIRVAGTGIYRDRVGSSMDLQGYIYSEVLRVGHELVIENPGHHQLCVPCKQWGCCSEKYEIAFPINVDGQTVGTFGLVCFTEDQARLVHEGRDSYLSFLGKMAETIALKLKEQDFLNKVVSSNRYLKSIIDCLEEGLLTIDLDGKILHFNRVAQQFFRDTAVLEDATLGSLVGHKIAADIIKTARDREEMLEREVRLGTASNHLRLLLRARPVETETGRRNIAITLHLLTEISRLVNHLSISEAGYTVDDILGTSEAICRIRERIKTVAPSNSTVLIQGESGTGKEMVARAIHNLSPRRQGPFVAINCSAIPESLLESELFGYEDGAFTGARKGGKLGKFELANKGTLFLDEIGDMPLFLQVKILRILQERRIERVGGLNAIPVDVRIIAATNRDLDDMVAQGEFRQDLYYRINVIPITIPPLRERKEDLDILCRHFIQVYNQELDKNVQTLSDGFRRKLWEYSWPGNVRELQNVIEYAMNLTTGASLHVEHLPLKFRQVKEQKETGVYNLQQLERETICRCLREFGVTARGKAEAAKALGIGIATLYRKIARYGIMDQDLSK